ncbi:MAG: lysine--tRNA ligase [Clostridia bacterium]|nr:lysine--tRNA ligase [Clostridia bacterium]MBR2160325.1 lysine--tRNA ligase [Clostridia bacterium]MBR6692831.1 lysine--tRNA ligase [Clostridia bacterium]
MANERINNNNAPVEVEQDLNEILRIRREKLAKLREMGKDPFMEDKFLVSHRSKEIVANYDELENKDVAIAGRIIARRLMGKASFIHILDGEGTIQSYIRIDDVGEETYKQFKEWDIGDIISVKGYVFKTRTGEVSVHAKEINLLSKSLLPLPEKYHGLTNPDLRYRQRYVDLIANPEVKEVFIKRSKIISTIREFMDAQNFLEVETPILNTIAGGASARPFITHHNTLDINMYLRIAPELYLKRLIVGGFEKVYEIGRVFRNEGMDMKHNPEFTIFECYWAYANLYDMIDITEGIYRAVCDKVLGTRKINFQGVEIDFEKPCRRLTMIDAVKEYVGIDFNEETAESAYPKLKAKGIDVEPDMTWGKLLYEAFDQKVEEQLIQPTFILDYPIEVSPLTKKKKDDPRLTARFEFFITSREMGNAYSELNDPIDQKERFEAQVKEREKGDDEAMLMDNDFVTALEYGLPPTGGLGLGIDRMVQFFTDNYSIRDVLLFPTMKPIK